MTDREPPPEQLQDAARYVVAMIFGAALCFAAAVVGGIVAGWALL